MSLILWLSYSFFLCLWRGLMIKIKTTECFGRLGTLKRFEEFEALLLVQTHGNAEWSSAPIHPPLLIKNNCFSYTFTYWWNLIILYLPFFVCMSPWKKILLEDCKKLNTKHNFSYQLKILLLRHWFPLRYYVPDCWCNNYRITTGTLKALRH